MDRKLKPVWKVHTPNLFQEVVQHSGHGIYKIPFRELGSLLFDVGERAAELNDPKLNALMCRLAIYAIADPESPDYNKKQVAKILADQGWM